jgi:hypothetical protein
MVLPSPQHSPYKGEGEEVMFSLEGKGGSEELSFRHRIERFEVL